MADQCTLHSFLEGKIIVDVNVQLFENVSCRWQGFSVLVNQSKQNRQLESNETKRNKTIRVSFVPFFIRISIHTNNMKFKYMKCNVCFFIFVNDTHICVVDIVVTRESTKSNMRVRRKNF